MGVIQIRGVSDEAHRRLKERAALRGQSLTEYLRTEIERMSEVPTLEEMDRRVASRPSVGGESAAAAIRAERDLRGG
jgi:antitoxin FitA